MAADGQGSSTEYLWKICICGAANSGNIEVASRLSAAEGECEE